jgi:alpha-L-fucosidase 2
MLLQSHNGLIRLLPALPDAWSEGRVTGLKARGDFEVDMNWADGKLIEVTVRAPLGGRCKLRYGKREIELRTRRGGRYRLNGELVVK